MLPCVQVGTPLTHSRYLRRHRGSYGCGCPLQPCCPGRAAIMPPSVHACSPAIKAGEGMFPGPITPIPGLYVAGDSTFPGIGLPAVAASGMICANTLSSVGTHLQMLDALGL